MKSPQPFSVKDLGQFKWEGDKQEKCILYTGKYGKNNVLKLVLIIFHVFIQIDPKEDSCWFQSGFTKSLYVLLQNWIHQFWYFIYNMISHGFMSVNHKLFVRSFPVRSITWTQVPFSMVMELWVFEIPEWFIYH